MTSTMLDTSAPPPRLSNILNTDSDENSTSADELDLPTENDTEADSSGRTKRMFAEHQTELDQGQPSKKRRKQSKPVRISALAGPADKDSEDEQDANEEGKQSVSNEHEASPVVEELAISTDVLNDTDKLTYFSETEQTQSKVQYHIEKSDTDAFLSIRSEIPIYSNVQKSESASPLDFMVGSWMSELQSKAEESLNGTKQQIVTPPAAPGAQSPFNDRKLVMPSYLPLGPPPFLIPIMPQGSGHNPSTQILQQMSAHGTGPSQPSIRIFNPDAYCELCNKEFCNKYFLKTHKANKHGIYVDSPSQTALSGPPVSGSPYAASFIAAAMTTPPSLILPTASQPQLAKSCPSIPQPTELEGTPKLEVEMKSSCDICHKRFCNRYFVRRHKVKIHGIVDDSIDVGCNTFSSLDGLQKQDYDEPESTSAGSDAGSNALETSYVDPPESEDIQSNTQNKRSSPHTEGSCPISPEYSAVDYAIETGVIKQENEEFDHDELSVTLPLGTVKKEGTFSIDRLRRLGVINADAFCEICCKEYCNKYFLRTHKMKRHGLMMSDADSKDCRPVGSSTGSGNSQTSPLNLIVAEQGTNSSDSGGKIRTELPDEDEPECDICGRRFQSTYLMQMHRAYLHGRSETLEPGKESNEVNIPNNEEQLTPEAGHLNNNNNIEDNENETKSNISADLQKLQTMISQLNNLNMVKITTCTICNKDLENSYFLRAHMMSDHGVLVEENNEIIGEKQLLSEESSPPPTPQSPSETFCHICKKDYFSKYFLKQHMDEFHGSGIQSTVTTSVSFEREQIKEEFDARETPDKVTTQIFSPISPEKRVSLTPTSSYCEICNKELCNKYFMKTHMQRMHGIEIENGAQIGGVICDVCNKELCSKYFLRVHKQNTHGIVEDVNPRDGSSANTNGLNINLLPPENDQALKATEFTDLNNRYFTHFTEVCYFCNRRFRSPKWLKAHLLNDHGEAGVGKWKELEQRYQLQQSKQLINKPPGGNNNVQHGGPNHSPTLKIPSAWSSQDQSFESSDQTGETRSQHVLSSLFGAGEPSGKSYHCSYCSFSTPVLAFLFVHERSHTGTSSQKIPDPAKPFQCPVCLQSFLQVDIFQHHIMTHQFSGLLNPFFRSNTSTSPSHILSSPSSYPNAPPASLPAAKSRESSPNHSVQLDLKECLQESDTEIVATVERDPSASAGSKNKFRCSRCFQRFRTRDLCQLHVQQKHGHKREGPAVSPVLESSNSKSAPHCLNKCIWCGFTSPHAGIMKKHIRKEHRVASTQQEIHLKEDSSESWKEMKVVITDDVKKKLQEAVRKCQIPASYAVPQNRSSSHGPFIMQPFLVEEPSSVHAGRGQLVPSLVFLPVREKLSEPLTVSVTLTPT